jgi:hypothetical protein
MKLLKKVYYVFHHIITIKHQNQNTITNNKNQHIFRLNSFYYIEITITLSLNLKYRKTGYTTPKIPHVYCIIEN